MLALRNPATAQEAVITYDGLGQPQTFTDTVNEVTWNLTVNGDRRITTIGVDGHSELEWSYSYDGDGNLLTVEAPGSAAWRSYDYDNDRMTASYDALGNLIEGHTYDADGHAISSTGDIDEIEQIEYGLPGASADESITKVTYKTGAIAEYTLRPVGSAWRAVRVTGGCASCGPHEATYVRDKRGRVIREQGADGYVNVTAYSRQQLVSEERFLAPVGCNPKTDSQQCRLDPDALAVASLEPTSATVKVDYQHSDGLWPDRVTLIERPSVAESGEVRHETYTYHPVTGRVASATTCGWKPDASQCEERTTQTAFYETGTPGLTPAFTPGGGFDSGWLLLAQPEFLPRASMGPAPTPRT